MTRFWPDDEVLAFVREVAKLPPGKSPLSQRTIVEMVVGWLTARYGGKLPEGLAEHMDPEQIVARWFLEREFGNDPTENGT